MVGCFFRVVERANRLLGTGLAAALFGAPELPRDLSSGVLIDWGSSKSSRSYRVRRNDPARQERRGHSYCRMINLIKSERLVLVAALDLSNLIATLM